MDAAAFRTALGHFCTGVTVITAAGESGPVGFACQAFAALSLDPPLVLFCPSVGSRSWQAIQRSGRFCVNVLADDQRELATRFGTSRDDKFAGVAWRPGASGAPVLDGALTWVEGTVETSYPAGDHHVVIGRATTTGGYRDARPLLFYRSGYTVTAQLEPAPQVRDDLVARPRGEAGADGR